MTTDIAHRKADHIELCAKGDVGFRTKTTLFEDVEFVHDALPELALDSVDTSVDILGKRLRFPLFIAAMTGGTDRARGINRELSRIAEERGYGFGLGSQRAMLVDGDRSSTYEVRKLAPSALVLGNIGAVQAKSLTVDEVRRLVESVGADALCVHMNPAMEIVQPGGDRDFTGALDGIARLVRGLDVPVVAKETGCGIGPRTAERLLAAGVEHVDVSGAGGTSWVAVETERASDEHRSLGVALREWGVPTAASVAICSRARGGRKTDKRRHGRRYRTIIATGGVATGIDVGKAISLGAHAAGIARPVLQAFARGGRDEAIALLLQIEAELRAVMLLVGARTISDLRKADTVIGDELGRWLRLARRHK